MKVFAVIAGVLALVLGGSLLAQANTRSSWLIVLFGWMPFIAGWGLA